MRPDEELLGVVVHSGLVLARSQEVVAALRRITAFPAGLSLDAVVLAREVHAEAADRREREATTQREAEVTDRREREATAQQDSKAAAQREAPQRLNGSVSASKPEPSSGTCPSSRRATRFGWRCSPLSAMPSGWTPTSRPAPAPKLVTGWKPPTG
jgi:hypothetical protein